MMIDSFLLLAESKDVAGEIFMLISPHAGYGFSASTAAFGYKLVEKNSYKTIIILAPTHHKVFTGIALYEEGSFATPLGRVEIDEKFIKLLIGRSDEIFIDHSAFNREHSIEVQLPFLQKVSPGAKIVPVLVGDCSLESSRKIANLFKEAAEGRNDVLFVISSDLYHGYDFEEADKVDGITLKYIENMDSEGLYYALREGKAQACGGMALVIGLNIANSMGNSKIEILNHTNSSKVTGRTNKGDWTVGYASCAVYKQEGIRMLNNQQKKRLLDIGRKSIEMHLKTGKKLQVSENDPALNQKMGAFVTLNEKGELRGCIGNLTGNQAIYLTVRDMAVEAAVNDPRFSPLKLTELNNINIEISVLSPLEKVDSYQKIQMGKHGVLVRKGINSGVFLPQVAMETGWSREEFLNYLCAHKAGLHEDAWRDKDTMLYVFTAEVFSEEGVEQDK